MMSKVIPFEHTESVEAEKYESSQSEMKKLENMREQLRQQNSIARDEYIKELQSGLGQQMKKVLSDPQTYMMKPVYKSKWQKFKESISDTISKILKAI